MALSNFLRQVFLFGALFVVTKGCGSSESLKVENRSTSLVKGCYCHNESLSLCFEIQPGFLQLTDKNNNVLARYKKLTLQRFHAQVLGNNFLWPHPDAEPLFLSPVGEETNTWVDEPILEAGTGLTGENEQSSPSSYQWAMEKLRSKHEVRLLDRVSHALHEEVGDHPITKAFYVMSMSLLREDSENTPAQDTETADHDYHRYLRLFGRKRNSCQDMRRDPNRDRCLGMCGPMCWCWSVVCDDCCFHQGCYEHDRCCGKNKLSGYCLFPFFYDFSCDSYGGYPDCIYNF